MHVMHVMHDVHGAERKGSVFVFPYRKHKARRDPQGGLAEW